MAKKSLTRLEQERAKKKELGELDDYYQAVDKPDGWKFVHKDRLREKKKTKRRTDDEKTLLEYRKGQRFTYRRKLAEYGQAGLDKIDWPQGWESFCLPTDGSSLTIKGRNFKTQEGILFIVQSPMGQVFCRGILSTMNPEYDLKAVHVMVEQAENTLDSERGLLLSDKKRDPITGLKQTEGGIVVPDG